MWCFIYLQRNDEDFIIRFVLQTHKENVMKLVSVVGAGSFMVFVIAAVMFTIGAICFPYTVNSWLEYTGKQPVFTWWMGGLLGLIPGLAWVSILGAVGTFIAMMFLGG